MAVAADDTVDTLLKRLGVSAKRVRLRPAPGTATVRDLVRANARGPACELVYGTLVEKPVGYHEEFLGGLLFNILSNYAHPRRLGHVCTGRTSFEMVGGNIRLPDVSITLMHRLPNPLPQIGGWCPDLCVEVLSPSNTRKEMAIKRAEFFTSGAKVVWMIEPKTRTAKIYTAAEEFDEITVRGDLVANAVLPGYRLPLKQLFDDFDTLLPPS